MIVVWAKIASWFKTWGLYLLIPGGLIAAAFVFFGKLINRQSVVAPEMVGASKKAIEEQRIAAAEKKVAEQKRTSDLEELSEKHEKALQELSDDQHALVTELQGDPDKTNAYLKDVGKDVRKR